MHTTTPWAPDINAHWTEPRTFINEHDTAAIWVHSGTAIVRTGTERHPLTADTVLLIPPGVPYSIHPAPESTVIPIAFTPESQGPTPFAHTLTITLGTEWHTALLHQFALSLGYLRGPAHTNTLFEALRAMRPPKPHPRTAAAAVSSPKLPFSPEARLVANHLIEHPQHEGDVHSLASLAHLSARALQQQFTDETGLALGQWHTATRVSVAAQLMHEGLLVKDAATRVGFATLAGFTKAFTARTGMLPSTYRSRIDAVAQPRTPSVTLPAPGEHQPPAPTEGLSTWSRINPFHVIVWAYRGGARVTIGGREQRLCEGWATWLPAGIANTLELEPGAVVLPLGSLPAGQCSDIEPGATLRVAPLSESALLRTVVANYTRLAPQHHRHSLIARLFSDEVRKTRRSRPSHNSPTQRAVDRIIAHTHHSPGDDRTLAAWSDELGVEAGVLGTAFALRTGQHFSDWRVGLRMTLAREHLEGSWSVEETARKLGYAHPSGLSKVFRKEHGMPPGTYRRSGWHHSRETWITR
ncbi:MAG: helix-turn-helix domain-containing protein [Microbacteriaceae bacterium]